MTYNLIPLTTTLSAVNISIMGYNFDWISNIALSSSSVLFPYTTAFNYFTNLRRVSSVCTPFSGYPLSSYNILDKNRLTLFVDTQMLTGTGAIDVVLINRTGYTKLSDKNYLIDYN